MKGRCPMLNDDEPSEKKLGSCAIEIDLLINHAYANVMSYDSPWQARSWTVPMIRELMTLM